MEWSLRLPKGLAIVFGTLQALPAAIFLLFATVMGPATAGFSGEVIVAIALGVALVALPIGLMIVAVRTRSARTCWICAGIILALTALTCWIVLAD